MSKVILTGNGLSVGLNSAFALQNITKNFYNKLSTEHRRFVEHHMERIQKGKYEQVDFEEGIASIEQVYDSLNSYIDFLKNDKEGKRFLETENLKTEDLEEHLRKIREIILSYTASIVEIIDGNVYWDQINEKLEGFINWLTDLLDVDKTVDLFTLNFDLLLETILLHIVGTEEFTDFHVRRGYHEGFDKFNFGPQEVFSDFGNRRVRLYHLHGSLSSFQRLSDGRLFKLRTEDIRLGDLYDNITKKDMFPSIITGGFKSQKVQRLPFSFYYSNFKEKMINSEKLCEELYIIGYSFRDEHINSAISERLKHARGQNPIELEKLVIVDFKTDEASQLKFIDEVNKALGLGSRTKLTTDNTNFIFSGANDIEQLIK